MHLIWLIPLLPGFGAALNGLVGIRFFGKRTSGLVACTTMALALAIAVWAFVGLIGLPPEARVYDVVLAHWIPPIALQTVHGIGAFQAAWSFRLDPLSSVMILVVTGVGFLIHVYSIGYMHEEGRGQYARYFSYLNLFCFFMLTLVLGGNFLVMFVGWEGVGLCSYLLIGYWYEKKSASDAGKKAFIVNRIGDWGFILGIFLVFYTFGTIDFRQVADAAATMPVETAGFGTLSLICLFLFIGATGKSAQIPLYVWLPDAMEGPTPVSALIHAATMVTAGVYMVSRNAVLFTHAPEVMTIVAIIGVLTAFMAATIGLVQNDIKRVLAYSTVSQLGYMFLATGVGAFAAAIFHLMTHAFFKALLFLGSGSVIHAMGGEQDMRKMGSLQRFMPVTYVTMLIATLAIAGVPPFSGFFSKDEILYRSFLDNRLLWGLGAITALLTAFYMFRLMSMTFYGGYRGPAWQEERAVDRRMGQASGVSHPGDPGAHGQAAASTHEVTHGPADSHGHGHGAWHGPHESPRVMTVPLMGLAVGAIVAGFLGVPAALGGNNAIERYLEPSFTASAAVHGAAVAGETAAAEPAAATEAVAEAQGEAAAHGEGAAHLSLAGEWGLMVLSVLLAAIGIWLAYRFYVTRPEISEGLAARYAGLHRVLLNKYLRGRAVRRNGRARDHGQRARAVGLRPRGGGRRGERLRLAHAAFGLGLQHVRQVRRGRPGEPGGLGRGRGQLRAAPRADRPHPELRAADGVRRVCVPDLVSVYPLNDASHMTNAAGFPLLSLILFTPLAGALLLLFVNKKHEDAIRWIANLFALAGFVVSLPLWFWFDTKDAGWQFVEKASWIPSIGAQYFLAVDGFSALMVLLTTLMGVIAILSSWTAITERVKEYYIFLLVLQTGMIGAFVSLDFLLFFLFWEVMLVPMYFLIGIWGGGRRLYSAIKFFLYTLVGSVVMLLGILALYFYNYQITHAYTFDVTVFQHLNLPFNLQWWIFLAFFLGFAIKVPMFPFHTWLPDAHTDAPTAGSVILAAVLLKMGTYGFIRFSLPILPEATRALRADDDRALDHRDHLRRARRHGAARLEAAGGLLEREPHGHGHAGHVRAHAGGHHRQHRAAAQPRHLDRRALPDRRHRLRAAPHARDLGVQRPVEGHAGLRGRVHDHDAVVDRHARAQRVHRRDPDPPGRVRREQALGGRGGERHRAGRGLHAVALPAHDVRQGREPEERGAEGPQPPRVRHLRAAHHPRGVDRPLPEAVPRPARHVGGERDRAGQHGLSAEREPRGLRRRPARQRRRGGDDGRRGPDVPDGALR